MAGVRLKLSRAREGWIGRAERVIEIYASAKRYFTLCCSVYVIGCSFSRITTPEGVLLSVWSTEYSVLGNH